MPQALAIFVAALALRLIHVWQIRRTPFFDVLMGDAGGYDQWAQQLAAGDWIGKDVFYQAPLYPYFLGVLYALFDRDLLIVRVVQAVIGSASCALLAVAGARLFSPKAGLVAGLGLALWPPAIFFDAIIQKSVLDVFFVCLGLCLIAAIKNRESGIRARGADTSWVALGAAMGGLALTRENALVFIAVIVLWIVLRGSTRREFMPFVAGLVLVLAPVVARNYSIDGRLYLTTSQFGSNFYIGNNPAADGTYASIRFGRGSPEFERIDATEVAETAVGRRLSPAEVSSYWTDRALDYIRSEPLAWLKLTGRKILLLVNRHEMLDTESLESHAEHSTVLWVLSWIGHFGILIPLAVAGAIVAWPDRRRLWILYALTMAYAASVVLFFVFARYRYPLVPFLLLFAVAPLALPIREGNPLSPGYRLRPWVIGAAVAAAAIVAWIPLLSPALMMAITENNLGTALQEHKRFDDAIRHHERAIELQPDYAPAYNNLGAALRAAGRTEEAVRRYREALKLRPDFPSASFNLGNALAAQGKISASEQQFRQTLKRSPQSVEARNNLGILLARQGDTAGAVREFRAALAIDERSVQAHRNLGNTLIDTGVIGEGLEHLERAAALAPNEPESLYDIATVLLQQQQFARAAARFEAALKIREAWPEAHNNLGIALASQGRVAEALTHFERALALRPGFEDARVNRDQARTVLKK
ncbi:MAG TPA: tetratricopeptide repeat protein [Vicinamibacterales bacterium]|nr:tetratricopeptide repeat protein [Vicinamibacterales bacterium]